MSQLPRKRILITGGSGFVGRHLTARLGELGRSVVATTSGSALPHATTTNIEWLPWNALREPAPALDWSAVDAVVHLAKPRDAVHATDAHLANHALSVGATFELLCKARAHGVRRFIFASTGYVLGACDGPARESDRRFQPREPYGAYKACGELITASFANELSTANLRFFFPYGPGGDRFFINRMVGSVQYGHEVRIDGAEGVHLNPVWIDDLVSGILLAIDSDVSGTFHLAGPETITLKCLVELIGNITNRCPRLCHVPAPQADWHVGDMFLARSELGFAPQTDLRTGLNQLINGCVEATS